MLKGEISLALCIDILEKYLSISPYTLPEGRGDPLNKPTLRHPGEFLLKLSFALPDTNRIIRKGRRNKSTAEEGMVG